jgi:membrane fusion protein (multidrug efflux system)
VKVGDQLGDRWLVTEGLKQGDPVIVDGVMRIGPGAPVQAAPAGAASAPPPAAPAASK